MACTTIQSRKMELTEEEKKYLFERTSIDMQQYLEGINKFREETKREIRETGSCVDFYGKMESADGQYTEVSLISIQKCYFCNRKSKDGF